jgi:hypothetical protein
MTSDTAVPDWTEEIPENTSGIVSHELNGDCHYTVSVAEDLGPNFRFMVPCISDNNNK